MHPVWDQIDARFDCTQEAYGFGYSEDDAVPLELPAGAALVFDGYLLHRSLPNTGWHGMRRALVNHFRLLPLRRWACSITGTYASWQVPTRTR